MTIEQTAVADIASGDMPPGRLPCLVADGLKARGFSVESCEHEDEYWFSVERWGGCCEMAVNDCGLVEWECVPWAGNGPDPKLTADIVTFLLTGKDEDYPRRFSKWNTSVMSHKGIVGNELRARGFDVGLDIYEDNDYFAVAADIRVANPVVNPNAIACIDDDGLIRWKCDYRWKCDSPCGLTREYISAIGNPARLADPIVATVSRAISLSSGASSAGAGITPVTGDAQ